MVGAAALVLGHVFAVGVALPYLGSEHSLVVLDDVNIDYDNRPVGVVKVVPLETHLVYDALANVFRGHS
jgi:hypothetical protein